MLKLTAWLRGEIASTPAEYPAEMKADAVARYVTGDRAEDVAVHLGLSPVAATLVELWAAAAGHPIRDRNHSGSQTRTSR